MPRSPRSALVVLLLAVVLVVSPTLGATGATRAERVSAEPSGTSAAASGQSAEERRDRLQSVASKARRKGKRTRLTILIDGCRECTVHVKGGYRDGWHQWSRTKPMRPVSSNGLRRGRAVVNIPTRMTRGLMVGIHNPGSQLEAVPFAVMRYADLPVGQLVPDPHYTDRAHACWAGTTKRRATLRMFTVGMESVSNTGRRGFTYFPVMYRGVRTVGASAPTWGRAGLATQDDSVLCYPK